MQARHASVPAAKPWTRSYRLNAMKLGDGTSF